MIYRWVEILNLPPEWATNPIIWKSEIGRKRQLGVVHPCQKKLGWTESNLRSKGLSKDQIELLIETRKIINTECDCLIQTPNRIIIVECKDKTNPKSEQRKRHEKLKNALKRLLKRDNEPVYIELTNDKSNDGWNWEDINNLAKKLNCSTG